MWYAFVSFTRLVKWNELWQYYMVLGGWAGIYDN